ncbi:MAG: C69 family dipeptidase, partial [Prevotella sp.]
RFHYDGTDYDPYLHNNGKEPWRPVSIFRTTQTHIIQVRPNLPQAIGHVTYIAMGMADLGVFLPLYQGVRDVPEPYKTGNGHADDKSAYWAFRKVMTLAMTNYNAYAPVVKEAYTRLERENDERQREFEADYLSLCEKSPMKALDLLQQFSDSLLLHALEVARSLENELFTRLTADIQKEYLFHGA